MAGNYLRADREAEFLFQLGAMLGDEQVEVGFGAVGELA